MLTGNIGKPGAGCHTWAGNYKAALFQGSPWTGPGFKGWVAEDPFDPNLDPKRRRRQGHHAHDLHEGRGARLLEPRRPGRSSSTRPKYGRKVFTGKTHMPTPTKVALVHQREPDQQRQVGLRHDQERQPEDRHDRLAGHRDDGVRASTPTSRCPPTPGSSSRTSRSPPPARTRSCRSGRAASSRSSTRKDDLTILAGIARRARPTRPATSASPTTGKFELEGKRERLHPAAARRLDDDRRLQARRHHGRQVRRARRRAHAVPHLPAHPVLRAGPRQRAVLHRHRPPATPTATSPRRSSTARTSSSTARAPRRRRTCRT